MKILVVKLSALGDLFHALPAVHSLKVGLDADIDWITHDQYVELVGCFKDVSKVIAFHRNSFFRNLGSFTEELRRSKYDYVIDMQGLIKSALVTMVARGGRKIGPSFCREGTCFLYGETAGNMNKERHAVEENMDVVRYLGVNVLPPVFPVEFPEVSLGGDRKKIGIVPVSRWQTKNWPARCYADVMKRLSNVHNAAFYLMGGPEDAEVCNMIVEESGVDAVNMAGTMSLVRTGGVIKEMDLLISNDSGPVHMAVAVQTPTLVIFGPTDPGRTGPYGEGHRVLSADIDCQPCFSRSCRRGGIPCLEGVTPERVGETALEMLK